MFLNKKNIIMLGLLISIGQIKAMKRLGTELTNAGKRQKNDYFPPVSCSWPNNKFFMPSQNESSAQIQAVDLKISPSEKSAFEGKLFDGKAKLKKSIKTGDFDGTMKYVWRVKEFSSLNGTRFFCSDKFTQEQKIDAAKQLKRRKFDFKSCGDSHEDIGLLSTAVSNNEPLLVGFFLSEGLDPNRRDKVGSMPIHLVADTQMADMLWRAGADLAAQCNNGNTLLHLVPESTTQDTSLATFCISRGVPFDIRNNAGLTSYQQGLQNFGGEEINPCLKDQESAAKMVRSSLAKVMGKPVPSFLFDRQMGRDKTSIYNIKLESPVSDSDSSSDSAYDGF